MSNLQTIARRCPVMSRALAVQSLGKSRVAPGGVAARGYAVKASAGKVRLHTSSVHGATAVPDSILVNKGLFHGFKD